MNSKWEIPIDLVILFFSACFFSAALFLCISCFLGFFHVCVKDQSKRQHEFALRCGFCSVHWIKIWHIIKKIPKPSSQIQLLVLHGLFLDRANYMSIVGGHTSTCYSVIVKQQRSVIKCDVLVGLKPIFNQENH